MLRQLARRRAVVCLIVVSLVASGCTRTSAYRVAAYRPGQEPTTRPVPRVGVYKVKVFGRDGELHGIDGTERFLNTRDVVGFRIDEASGAVRAVVNDTAIPLDLRPEQRVVWYTRHEEQTQFGEEVGEALAAGGTVVGVVLLVGVLGIGIGVGLALAGDHDDWHDRH
jgi:hypothetical protein